MSPGNDTIFDPAITTKTLVQNTGHEWGHLYDKYAPLMYGIILNITNDKRIAEKILKKAFLELTKRKILSEVHLVLPMDILRHTYEITLKQMQSIGRKLLNPQPFNGNYPLTNLFYFGLTTVREAAIKFGLTEAEVQQRLREELNQIRNQKNGMAVK